MANQPDPLPAKSQLTVIGAGPIGLEATAWASSRGWDVALFEKGQVGHHLQQWGHVKLFSPFAMNHSKWGPRLIAQNFPEWKLPSEQAYLSGHEYREQYLIPLSRLPALQPRLFENTRVLQVGKEGIAKEDRIGDPSRGEIPFRLLIRRQGQEMIHRAQAVLDCSGVYSSPRFLGNGNIPAPGELEARRERPDFLMDGLVNLTGQRREEFKERKVLLVGGGYSAATALEGFVKLLGDTSRCRVWWINRTNNPEPYSLFPEDPLPYRDELGRLANRLASEPPPWLRYLGGSQVEAISSLCSGGASGFRVQLSTPGGQKQVVVEHILSHTGFMPDNSIYRQLQVHECYATAGPIKLAAQLLGGSGDCLAQAPPGLEQLTNPEPRFFILGNKSYGTNSTFLLQHGISQLELVLEHLAGVLQAPSRGKTPGS